MNKESYGTSIILSDVPISDLMKKIVVERAESGDIGLRISMSDVPSNLLGAFGNSTESSINYMKASIVNQVMLFRDSFGIYPKFIDVHEDTYKIRGFEKALSAGILNTGYRSKVYINSKLANKYWYKKFLQYFMLINYAEKLKESLHSYKIPCEYTGH